MNKYIYANQRERLVLYIQGTLKQQIFNLTLQIVELERHNHTYLILDLISSYVY